MSNDRFLCISEVLQTYVIKYEEAAFIVPTDRIPSAYLPEMLQFVGKNTDVSVRQGGRKPLLVTPILLDVFRFYGDRLAFWVEKPFHDAGEFVGILDFVFALKSPLSIPVMGEPRVLIVEAKKNDFRQGWGQCLDHIATAQKINGKKEKPIYGIVTDGVLWEFGTLRNAVFTEDRGNYFTDNLVKLFGAIDFVLQASLFALPHK